MQKLTDPAPRTCPECGSHKIAKLVSRAAFQLKGGGWYADLYASRKKDAKPDHEGSASTAKPAAKDDKKPAASAPKASTPKPGG